MRLFDSGNDLPPDRAIFIRRVNEVEEEGRNAQCEPGVGQLRAGVFLRRERRHEPLQLAQSGNAVAELPLPTVPVFVRNVAPKCFAGRVKSFESITWVRVRSVFALCH